MTKANPRSSLTRSMLIAAAAASATIAAAAQTPAHHTASTTHHTATGAHHPAISECVTLPEISPKVPALPAGTPCAKALFTVGERLDYISPLVGPEVKEDFGNLPMVFSLAYIDTKVGTGELARPHMWYTVQYTGYLSDGTKFDSSLDHPDAKPISFPYGAHQVIPGWDMGFEGMHIGGKRRLFIPYQLAYGERGRPPVIPAKSELIFDMELVSESADNPNPRPPAPPAPPRPPAPGQPTTPTPGTAPGATPQSGQTQSGQTQSGQTQSPRPRSGPDVKPTPPAPGTTTPPPPAPQARQSPPTGQ